MAKTQKLAPPTNTTCNDPLAINYGEVGDCEFKGFDPETPDDENGGCGCNGGTNGTNGNTYLGIKRSTWIWIVIGAIVAYYIYKRNR